MSAEANGNGAATPAVPAPAEQVGVGWVRMPDATYRATVTFADAWGQRTHLLDGAAAALVGGELARLARFCGAGLEPPPAEAPPGRLT